MDAHTEELKHVTMYLCMVQSTNRGMNTYVSWERFSPFVELSSRLCTVKERDIGQLQKEVAICYSLLLLYLL